MIIHAMHLWPDVATKSLWPHSMSLETEIRNKHKLDKKKYPLLRNYHTWLNPSTQETIMSLDILLMFLILHYKNFSVFRVGMRE